MTRAVNFLFVLVAALTALAGAAAAQEPMTAVGSERVPQADSLLAGVRDQFTLDLPIGWTAYDQRAALSGGPSHLGVVLFSAEPVLFAGSVLPTPEILGPVSRGDVPGFFVDRYPARKGMSCSRLTSEAQSAIELLVEEDPIFGGLARRMLLPKRARTSQIQLAGCEALKLEAQGRVGSEKEEWRLDVRVVSDGETVYLFSLRNPVENFAKNFGAFEAALATLKLSPKASNASVPSAAPPTGSTAPAVQRSTHDVQMPHYSFAAPPGGRWHLERADGPSELVVLSRSEGPFTYKIRLLRNTIKDRASRRATAKEVADDYRELETQIMIDEGVEPGLYRLEGRTLGEETLNGLTFYTMKYSTIGAAGTQRAALYLWFPKPENNHDFIVAHYSENLPTNSVPSESYQYLPDFQSTLQTLAVR